MFMVTNNADFNNRRAFETFEVVDRERKFAEEIEVAVVRWSSLLTPKGTFGSRPFENPAAT
jgi:hypothetical protein